MTAILKPAARRGGQARALRDRLEADNALNLTLPPVPLAAADEVIE
jgi:hypothetical protein